MKIFFRFLSILLVFLVGQVFQAFGQTPSVDSTQTPAPAIQAVDPAKMVEIRKMLDLTGSVKQMNQMLSQMVDTLKSQNGSVSPDFWDRFEKEVNTQEFIDKMIPLYDKYYTLDDLKAFNAFYESPAGQKFLAAAPDIMRESTPIRLEWGRNVAARLMDELKKEKAISGRSSGN